MDFCLEGYHAFRRKYFNKHNKRYDKLVKYGQRPKMLVVSCSDSRVDPAILLNCEPGDLFVVRNVANLVPPYENDNGYHGTSAALEFGICGLGITKIVILGHTQCGGINRMIEQRQSCKLHAEHSFVDKWMEIAGPAYEEAIVHHAGDSKDVLSHECGKYAIINSWENLKSFPWVSEKLLDGSISIYLWNFDLSTGLIEYYNQDEKRFQVLK